MTSNTAERPSRADYLLSRFHQRIDFIHRKLAFSYVHIENLEGNIIVGKIGRPETEIVMDAPETGFAPVQIPIHRAVNLFLDFSSDPEGQKVAVQIDPRVGTPAALLESMVNHINDADPDSPWVIDARPMIDAASFWQAVEKYENEITKVTFKLVAPNIFGFTDNVSEEMKLARDENNANIATISLENKEGLRLRTSSIENAVNYVAAGGGVATLKSRGRKLFDSKKKQRTVTLKDDVAATVGMGEILKDISRKLFGR